MKTCDCTTLQAQEELGSINALKMRQVTQSQSENNCDVGGYLSKRVPGKISDMRTNTTKRERLAVKLA